jgi:hypothetical protein
MEIKYKILGITLVCVFLCALFFGIATSGSGTNGYDPWVDLNDDGNIDYNDLYIFARAYGSSGTPINKTALLLELLARIDSLNASLIELQSRVKALESRLPKKGYISISPAAFTPAFDTSTFLKGGSGLWGQGGFYVGLQLPHGAIITNMSVLLTDSSDTSWLSVDLMGYNITGRYNLDVMASISTVGLGAPGEVILHDDTISNAIIDNRNCEYYLRAYLSAYDVHLYLQGIILEYQYPQ